MANPRWFMDAGDEAFSIVGKLFKKGDPAADAMLRVLARRAKSAPDAEKFYDPAQELMEKVPATSWKQALDRMEEIRVQTDKDADVMLPWKWEGGRADDIAYEKFGDWHFVEDKTKTSDFIKQQRRQAKSFREKSTGEMRPAKAFSREFVRLVDDQKAAYNSFGRAGRNEGQSRIAKNALILFGELQKQGVPRDWTGEAGVAAIKRARLAGQKKVDAMVADGTKFTPEEYTAELNHRAYIDYVQTRGSSSEVLAAIDLNKEKLEQMTNRQRAMFFELLGDWEDSFEGLADTAIALAQ